MTIGTAHASQCHKAAKYETPNCIKKTWKMLTTVEKEAVRNMKNMGRRERVALLKKQGYREVAVDMDIDGYAGRGEGYSHTVYDYYGPDGSHYTYDDLGPIVDKLVLGFDYRD